MKEYHKINSVYKRDAKGKFTEEFSQPEFEYLFNNQWIGTEKLDGTNIRIGLSGGVLSFSGRTDNSQMPSTLAEWLRNNITKEKIEKAFADKTGIVPVDIMLFGEGVGKGIQKVGQMYSEGVMVVLFDVCINGVWLNREDVIDISDKLDILTAPVIIQNTLGHAIDMVKAGYTSKIGVGMAEGLVLTPAVQMLTRTGHRIITKVKTKDFTTPEEQ